MSWDIAQTMFVGRLTRNPEVTHTQGGTAVSKFFIAVGHGKRKGQEEDEVSFFNLVAFGKTAEVVGTYLTKGSQIAALCEPKQNRWTDKDGKKRDKVEFIITRLEMLGKAKQSGGSDRAEDGSIDYRRMMDDDMPFKDVEFKDVDLNEEIPY